MKNINEMSKEEMVNEIEVAKAVVNNGGELSQERWNRVVKMMRIVK